jgi:hypothetical protein
MSDSIATIERLVNTLADQDLDATLQLYSPHATWEIHVPGWDALLRGHEQIASRYIPWFINRDGYEIVGYQVIGQGEVVALRWEQHWRDDRDGAPCTCHQSHFFDVREGLIERHWMYCSGVTVWEYEPETEVETTGAHGESQAV